MNGPILPIVLWGIWTLILLGGLISGVIRYRDSRAAAREREGAGEDAAAPKAQAQKRK